MAREPQNGRIGGGVLKDNLVTQREYLNFKNTKDDTAVLHLDIETQKIGIGLENPSKDLTVNSKIRSENINIDRLDYLPGYVIENNNITVNSDDIFLKAPESINLTGFSTDDILINGNVISTYNSSANIDLIPSGAGTVEFLKSTNIYGNINATGNISMGGDLIFGDGPETPDTVSFGTSINSNIVPDSGNTYSLGSSTKKWKDIYSNLLNGQVISANDLTVNSADLALRPGNVFYVSINGNDTNVGDHQQGPFRTIKRALEAADASTAGPVTINIYPGVYEEEFPLEVPTNVSIKGVNLRSVTVKPTLATQTNDAFLLNGETSIEGLTVTDFYSPGYAFRFASGAIVTTRSPYVRDITVITKGSVTSATDPRGFDAGDAGKGVLIDGADVDPASANASILFHAVTFITPGVDAVTLTNGVRIEWLNSFTYFANRGLYATNGATGHLSTDGSTVEYGAEIRSIGSANIYGNYGAVADGNDCVMYLINHNFAYIGTGKEVTNDRTKVIEDQQWLEINNGSIYVQNTDELGKFKVGDDFFVDFDLGTTSIDADNVAFDGLSQITVGTGADVSILNDSFVQTGNIRFAGNTMFSLTGSIELDSATNETNFEKSVRILKDLDLVGNLTLDGELITFGDQPTDTVNLNVDIDQDFIPDVNNQYSLGSELKVWNQAFLDRAEIDDITIFDNVITTSTSNANLEFKSNQTGFVRTEGLKFNTATISTDNTDIDITIGNKLYIDADKFVVPKGIEIDQVSQSGALRFHSDDLLFEGYGDARITFGGVYSDNRRTSVVADKTSDFIDLTVNNIKVGEINSSGFELHGLQSDSIFIDQNTITTVDSNADLWLRRKGTGTITLDGQEYFRNSTWTNPSINDLTIYSTSRGYVKFDGNKGSVLGVSGTLTTDNVNELSIGTDVSSSNLWANSENVKIDEAESQVGNGIDTTTDNFVIGSQTNGTQSFFVDLGLSNIDDVIDIFLSQVRFRGNFQDSNEYVDLTLPDSSGTNYTVRIGEFEDNGNNINYTVSGVFDAVSQNDRTYANTGTKATGFAIAIVESGGTYGINVTVDVPATLNTPTPGMTNLWELEISYSIRVSDNKFVSYEDSSNNYYYMFDVDTSTVSVKDRYLVTDSLDLTGFTRARLRGKVILGNGTNGSRLYNGQNILLQFSEDGTDDTGMITVATIVDSNNRAIFSIWTEFEVFFDISDSSIDFSNIKFRILQENGGNKGENPFALSDLQLAVSVDDGSSPPVGTFRYDPSSKQSEVFEGTRWIPATGEEVDPVTDELMEEVVGVWSLILG